MNRFAVILLVGLVASGCSSPPVANARNIKLEFTGTGNVTGTLQANSPSDAGWGRRNIEVAVPGKWETKGGPSEYTIVLNGLPRGDTMNVWVDTRQLVRGPDMVWEDDKGPRVTFTIK